jgi:predicted metalloenzyme YecM
LSIKDLEKEVFPASAVSFLKEQINFLRARRLINQYANIDHLCFRVSSKDEYLKAKTLLSEYAELLVETNINGRPIATYKLDQPLKAEDHWIDLIELPAPKAGKIHQTSFEHIEVVYPFAFDTLIEQFPDLRFDTKSTKKLINGELKLINDRGQIKFHHQSLHSIIRLEHLELFSKLSQDQAFIDLSNSYDYVLYGNDLLGQKILSCPLSILVFSDEKELKQDLKDILQSLSQNFRIDLKLQHSRDPLPQSYLQFLLAEQLLKIDASLGHLYRELFTSGEWVEWIDGSNQVLFDRLDAGAGPA